MTVALLSALAFWLVAAGTPKEAPANVWVEVAEGETGPRSSPALVWSGELKRFVLIGGTVSHQFSGERPYDVLSLDLATRRWRNDLPKGAEAWGGETGPVTDPGFNTPYFSLTDVKGLVRPSRRHFTMWYQYAYAPWDGQVYVLLCGRTLRYDPAARTWTDLKPPSGPAPESRSTQNSLNWGAMCADPVNREIVLFGGGGLATERVGPGTWVYSPQTNAWRDLRLKVQPPVRALSPMVFDAKSRKIVVFGGERLDLLYADTWVYDPATRTWAERTPEVSPAPRFGHALLYLPKSGAVLLAGGNHYTSSVSRSARMYQGLPFEMWTYDVAGNRWQLIRRVEGPTPPASVVQAAVAAIDEGDTVLLLAGPAKSGGYHTTWTCAVDPSVTDEAGTAKYGVKPGTTETRTGPHDPDWYTRDLPPADVKAVAAVLEALPANEWVSLQCPRWPLNRAGGGWSTTAFDPDRGQILHLGGGHVSYFGNDVAHYDIATGRWSISYRPQFALEYNYGLSGPGPWAFNLGPWGNHNYQAYAYDPTCKRLVYIKEVGKTYTQLYDPAERVWRYEEKFTAPFAGSKYTTYVEPTPQGLVAWAPIEGRTTARGLWLLEGGKAWRQLPLSGDPLPTSVCDGSTLTYDSKRDRLIFTTTSGSTREPTACGQVWAYDFAAGAVRKLDPAGMDALKVNRFAREAVYLPKADLVMLGYRLDVGGKWRVPLYDCAKNAWLTADLPGSDFISGKNRGGCSVDLGLAYDPKRNLVWGVLCSLHPGSLNVLRLDAASLAPQALEPMNDQRAKPGSAAK